MKRIETRRSSFKIGVLAMCAVAAALGSPLTNGQEAYPSKPLSILTTSVGGSTEPVIRAMGNGLGERLGKPVTVEARGGGGGTVAAIATLRAPSDGHTLLFIHSSAMTLNPLAIPNIGYDTQRDFVALGQICGSGATMVMNPATPVRNVKELIAYAKANPGKLSLGLAGFGNRLALAQLALLTGAKFNETLYAGEPQMVSAVMGGHIDLAILNPGTAKAQAEGGKIKIIANTSPKRMSALPDVETINEVVPGWEFYNWFGLYAPSATPRDRLDRLASEVNAVAQSQKFRELCMSVNLEPIGTTSQQAQAVLKSEIERNARIIRESNIKFD